MQIQKYIKRVPWDSTVFGLDTYEIQSVSVEIFEQIIRIPGHYSVKINPLSSKKILHDYGFYYCDTLIELYCTRESFVFYQSDLVSISHSFSLDALLTICNGAFIYGRFHRDFNLNKKLADNRYNNWLKELYHAGNVYSLVYNNELAGFLGFSGNKHLLGAISKKYQGKGLGKYLWSIACKELFKLGYTELQGSVSAANLPVVNLYATLGFRFRNSVDVYHRIVK